MGSPNQNQSPDPSSNDRHPDELLKAFVEKIKQEVDDQPDLIKQCVADLNAQERQNTRNHSRPAKSTLGKYSSCERFRCLESANTGCKRLSGSSC
jgi:hypothetical protein